MTLRKVECSDVEIGDVEIPDSPPDDLIAGEKVDYLEYPDDEDAK